MSSLNLCHLLTFPETKSFPQESGYGAYLLKCGPFQVDLEGPTHTLPMYDWKTCVTPG